MEKFLHFHRCQHCRGLVEDENIDLAVEHLEDLDALLHAERQSFDRHIERCVQPGVLHKALEALARRVELEPRQHAAALIPEDDVLQRREGRHEGEVLVHHANACR